MRYWWDKIKVVTDDLQLWDNLQVLWFDTCWYLLIGEWNDTYGNIWDPLTSTTEACYDPGECPMCQPKITDIMDLPWRPEPCSSGDWFLMMDRYGDLKIMCKNSLEDNDEKVKVDSGDCTAGYLQEKITTENNSPITINKRWEWCYHTLELGFDTENLKLNAKDLKDVDDISEPGILWTDGEQIKNFTPTPCPGSKYSYIIYNSDTNSIGQECPRDTSLARWTNTAEIRFSVPFNTTYTESIVCNSAAHIFQSTDDILPGNDCLFIITRPWVYFFSATCTVHNESNAWWLAVRAWLTLDGIAMWDYKYEARRQSAYLNDEYPQVKTDYQDGTRDLDFRIISFTSAFTFAIPNASMSNYYKIWYDIKVDGRSSDHRQRLMDWSGSLIPQPDPIRFHVTNWGIDDGNSMVVSAARIWDVPSTYRVR